MVGRGLGKKKLSFPRTGGTVRITFGVNLPSDLDSQDGAKYRASALLVGTARLLLLSRDALLVQ